MRSHIGRARESKHSLQGCGNLSLAKRTISAGDRLGLLQMVSEKVTGWPPREVDGEKVTGWCASEDVEPLKEVDGEIPHWLERETKHSL